MEKQRHETGLAGWILWGIYALIVSGGMYLLYGFFKGILARRGRKNKQAG